MIRGKGALVLMVFAIYAPPGGARQAAQQTFSSAEAAADALFLAVQTRDKAGLAQLLGGKEEIFASGDESQDDLDRLRFLEKFREMHRLAYEPEGTILYIGAENWPFPVPLISKDGAWSFDTRAGMSEILFRRIGANESSAIAICQALAHSDEDTAAFLHKPVPIHGYYFRALPAAGKPASFLAYPADYGSSGVMTFVVDQDVIYERDLGPRTANAARSMTRYTPDSTWQPVQ
ncbi:MAG: DUF2950 family protein [Myxococcales bacterium]